MSRVKQPSLFIANWIQANLRYDSATGLITKDGRIVGTTHLKSGYVRVSVGNSRVEHREIQAHHIAWFFHHGQWPTEEIDHIDLNPSNNQISNLRATDHGHNAANTRKRNCRSKNSSRYKGVYRDRTRWQAKIKHAGVDTYLGSFSTEEEAHEAYVKASVVHGAFARSH